jgi:uncharacterized protein (TIGR00730 family)
MQWILERAGTVMAAVCVFCGAKAGDDEAYCIAGRRIGQFVAEHGHTLIYGGGGTGVMGAIADSALAAGGRVIGVIPTHLTQPEVMHTGVADMRVTRDMHERKALMHSLSDVYVALPGGFGTMEELFEAVTWAQLELHARPIAVLNLNGLYDGLIELLGTLEARGFLSAKCRALLDVFTTVDDLTKWLRRQLAD